MNLLHQCFSSDADLHLRPGSELHPFTFNCKSVQTASAKQFGHSSGNVSPKREVKTSLTPPNPVIVTRQLVLPSETTLVLSPSQQVEGPADHWFELS